MRYLSVCSGIEAASVAWHHLGWTPVAFSEIEPFPAAVLAHRFPNVPNYGDMTKHEQWPIEPGSIDLLVGGTPCQSFSVAGLRKGISDPRGGLMLTYLEIARRLRPRWIVWENVPGVLSSGGGRDFGSFLGALGELGYGWAYRVIDAQYCRVDGRWPKAVPQRRRRVFVVGCLLERDPRGRERAAEVLALGTGLRWHLEESGKARKAAPSDAEAGARAGCVTSHDVAPCLETTCHDYSRADGFTMVGEVSATIAARFGNSRNNHEECVAQPVAGTIGNRGLRSHTERDGHGAYIPVQQPVPYDLFQITAPVNRQNRKPGDPCHTLARDNAAHAAVAFTPGNLARGAGPSPNAEVAPTQRCSAGRGADDQRTCVAFHPTQDPINSSESSHALGTGSKGGCATAAVAHALRGEGFDASEDKTGRGTPLVPQAMTVRRLTPTECSRLQGFPDDWTLIPWRGKPAEQCPDGPRYKALGNSMAVNCMAWIGERIAAVEDTHA